MSEVKRYDIWADWVAEEHLDGNWVVYDDYAELESENAKLKQENERHEKRWQELREFIEYYKKEIYIAGYTTEMVSVLHLKKFIKELAKGDG